MKVYLNTYINNNYSVFNQRHNIKYTYFTPLERDTICFTGAKNVSSKKSDNVKTNIFNSTQNKQVCNSVHKNAEPARVYLEELLNRYLSPILNEYERDKKPFSYVTGIKSSKSIKQKIIYKLPEKIEKESQEFAHRAINELTKSFGLKKNISENEIYNIIINNSKYKIATNDTSAFKSANELLKIIKKILEGSNIMDLGEDERRQKKELKRISQHLSATAPHVSEENYKILGCADANGRIKSFIHDIVRGRIVIREKDPILMHKILQAFKNMVNDGNVKITSIEFILPDPGKLSKGKNLSDYTPIMLNLIPKTTVELKPDELIKRKSKSGYCAVHINMDLSNKLLSSYGDKYNGYSAEIQIMDKNVLDLKEIEDLLYKFDDSIPLSDKEYKPMAELFKSKLTPDIQKKFDEYRYKLYLQQLSSPISGKKNVFPTIKDMGYEGVIPPELDFNSLKKFKDKCDLQIKQREKEENLKEKYKKKNSDDYTIDAINKIIKSAVSKGMKFLSQ